MGAVSLSKVENRTQTEQKKQKSSTRRDRIVALRRADSLFDQLLLLPPPLDLPPYHSKWKILELPGQHPSNPELLQHHSHLAIRFSLSLSSTVRASGFCKLKRGALCWRQERESEKENLRKAEREKFLFLYYIQITKITERIGQTDPKQNKTLQDPDRQNMCTTIISPRHYRVTRHRLTSI